MLGILVEVRFVGGSPLCYACVITARLSDYPLPHRKPEKKVREADLCEDLRKVPLKKCKMHYCTNFPEPAR